MAKKKYMARGYEEQDPSVQRDLRAMSDVAKKERAAKDREKKVGDKLKKAITEPEPRATPKRKAATRKGLESGLESAQKRLAEWQKRTNLPPTLRKRSMDSLKRRIASYRKQLDALPKPMEKKVGPSTHKPKLPKKAMMAKKAGPFSDKPKEKLKPMEKKED